MLVTKEFTFDSAHYLPNYYGKCENLHGHTYKLHITIQSKVNKKDGMAMDFCEIKDIVKNDVLEIIDHSNLNDVLEIPSAENISIWIWDKLSDKLPLYEIVLWETPTSFVTYRGPDKE